MAAGVMLCVPGVCIVRDAARMPFAIANFPTRCAGKLFTAGSSAAVGVDLNVEEHLMAGREGIIIRALGDGQQYVVQLTQGLLTQLIVMAGLLAGAAHYVNMRGLLRRLHRWQCALCLVCSASAL